MERDPVNAYEAEGKRIAELLAGLSPEDWNRDSSCAGWTIQDVVLHLAQTEEAVIASVRGEPFNPPARIAGSTVDELMDEWVRSERGEEGPAVAERWHSAHQRSVSALGDADPDRAVAWAAAPLKPRTLATTRLSEHWIHGLDITEPLGLSFPDTDRLWHIARLAHRTLPYAYARAGRNDAPAVELRLNAPDNSDVWVFGDDGAECRITGSASELCRLAARRLSVAETSLEGDGSRCDEVLDLIRTYA